MRLRNIPGADDVIQAHWAAIKNEKEYNAMFTDKYYETTEPYVRFTPQMVYDIHIEKVAMLAAY